VPFCLGLGSEFKKQCVNTAWWLHLEMLGMAVHDIGPQITWRMMLPEDGKDGLCKTFLFSIKPIAQKGFCCVFCCF
jgi:hypothetical protein